MPPKYDESECQHPSVDTSGRFALDYLLRRYGWRIWRRRGRREAVWRDLHGDELGQNAILKLLPASQVQDAQYAEELYYRGKLY